MHPPGQDTEDAVRWWQAYQLADGEHVDELRQRARAGSYHAVHELARWLAYRDRLEELRELAVQRLLPLGWLAAQSNMNIVRLAADLGDDQAREHLERWLGRMRERSRDGDERARRVLAEWPDGEVLVSGK